jgi:hypothetical protein
MSYSENKYEIASNLWSILHKGDLLFSVGSVPPRLVPQTGLSGGQAIVHGICAAIVDPKNHRMPPLDDIADLPPDIRAEVLGVLTDLLGDNL